MLFLAPNTSKVIFIDNYHQSRGQKGVDLNTGAHAPEDYVYPSTTEAVFSTEVRYFASLRPPAVKANRQHLLLGRRLLPQWYPTQYC